jgi:pimeloyl-ACP methyl ester carboxylesterase
MDSEDTTVATSAPATTRLIVSARCERLTVDGQIEAWAFGEPGRPLVFVQHGLGSRKERMLELALRLAEARYRAVAVDAPAHGDRRNPESSARLADPGNPDFVPFLMGIVQWAADDLARVAAALGETRWAVAGHSLGGRIALDALHRHPGTVCAAAIGAPFGDQLLPDNLPPLWRERIDAAEPQRNPHHYAPRPVLLAHAADDPVTPASGSRAVADALREAYPLGSGLPVHVEIPTGGHDLVPELQEAVVGFLTVHFPAP